MARSSLAKLSASAVAGLMLCACAPNKQVIERIANEELGADALVVQAGDASAGGPIDLYVVKTGEGPDRSVFQADRVTGLKVGWATSNHLVVRAAKARVLAKATDAVVGGAKVVIDVEIAEPQP